MKLTVLFFLFFVLLSSTFAANFVSNALGSNMVLQRGDKGAVLWGWSKSETATVTVKFGNRLYTTSAGTAGKWSLTLPPTPAGGPYDIGISSSIGESAALANVLFGDVYVCGGQSNMQFTVDEAFNATEEVQRAANYPNIRVFTAGTGTISDKPLEEFGTIEQHWSVASPKTIGVGNWSAFSAVCWFFGRDLYDQYKVPLGLVSDNWGGTYIQAWSSPQALAKCGEKTGVEESLVKDGADPNQPSVLWNAMIVPILPMSITGATWYQGESNAGHADYYACAFPEMIKDWRLNWKNDFGFYYVQLAPWLAGDTQVEALLRLSQLYANTVPKVGYATAMDLGDTSSPFGSIHPRNKQTVGVRLSTAAKAITYGEHVQWRGPEATSFNVVSGTGAAVVEVNFDAESVGKGLVLKPATCAVGAPADQCSGFEIETSKGTYVVAQAAVSGAKLRVSANIGDATVTGVRYGNNNYPLAFLWNDDGFPGIPFAFPNPIRPTTKN